MKRLVAAILALLVVAILGGGGYYGWLEFNKTKLPATTKRHQAQSKSISVEYGYAFATPADAKTGAAFMILRNLSGEQDFLLGVKTDIAKQAELHETFFDNNIAMMRKIDKVEIPE